MVQNRDEPVTMEDTMLIAFMKLKGLTVSPWVCIDEEPNKGRVMFEIVGGKEEIEKAMQAYFGNETVGVQDYVRCLKETKTEMYNMKKLVK